VVCQVLRYFVLAEDLIDGREEKGRNKTGKSSGKYEDLQGGRSFFMHRKFQERRKGMEKSYTVNRVEGFDPYEYLVPLRDEITGEVITTEGGSPMLYLPASAKKVWFQKAFPEGCVLSQRLPRDDGQYEFVARVYRNRDEVQEGVPVATGYALRMPSGSEKYRPFESAQTLAEARALENAGFGSEVSLYLLMQEAENLQAPAEMAAQAIDLQPSFTVKAAEEGTADEEALRIFEKLGVKGAGKSEKRKEKQESSAKEEETAAEKKPQEEVPETEPEKEQQEPPENASSAYVITAGDVKGLHALDPFIGKSLAELGTENIKSVLSLAGGKISPSFRKAAEEFTKEAA